MPIITLQSQRPLTDVDARVLAGQLTQLTAHHLRKDPTVTVVRVVSGEATGQWFVEGQAPADTHPLCALNIQITRGTNSKQEKEAWLEAVWGLIGAGSPPLPHYLSIVELDADQWGYNGLTQQKRKEQQG
ncbi:hypothetical protein [Chromobacterium amazonense]|uniref:4-oxalocrotonate tautomerase n=1 Tax=Chromobacterium amazonense TaxID=1382803 RepID=A0ABU8UZR8_9NEIS|nr:hypothetical protein [Chromobacterium amazonense]MDQ4539853.1 hypothetical protein [Chromobacterium amazonense]